MDGILPTNLLKFDPFSVKAANDLKRQVSLASDV